MLICADHFTMCSSYLAMYTLWYMMDLADTYTQTQGHVYIHIR